MGVNLTSARNQSNKYFYADKDVMYNVNTYVFMYI